MRVRGLLHVRYQRYLIVLILVFFIVGMIQGIALLTNTDLTALLWRRQPMRGGDDEPMKVKRSNIPVEKNVLIGQSDKKTDQSQNKRMDGLVDVGDNHDGASSIKRMEIDNQWPEPDYDVHVFYYPWYGNPQRNHRYLHWNHRFLPHWDKDEAMKWPKGQHVPPDDIGANFYPELGAYSSGDPQVIEKHMQQIRSAGIGVIAVSWYPPGQADQPGAPSPDMLIPLILDVAQKYRLKVCLHVEPYKSRDHMNFRNNLVYISKYNTHPAMYKLSRAGKALPLYYVYDSYLTNWDNWGKLFRKRGSMTVRDTDLDGIFIGLVAHENHRVELMSAGFDGFYTYFASNGFTYGSSTSNWDELSKYAKQYNGLFIPSVGPGYIDTRVRPWNRKNSRYRKAGKYYDLMFQSAIENNPQIISITSFNEWHEGTQIEKAVPYHYGSFRYLDYSPYKPDHYLMLTKKWIQEFKNSKSKS